MIDLSTSDDHKATTVRFEWIEVAKKLGNASHIAEPANPQMNEARRLLSIVEKSQVPFGESANLYASLKSKIEANGPLSTEEYEQLQRLAKIARDWERGVESSARTEPEETLAG